ncbi:DUF2637 domain-containing protein [Actinopolymorpha sp. B9G3]|uniref:DUF2637 domain-containing protein n=1 Tax=Actinopolymorpha sp. B9G3 TaxID=3158970 RepID=UPI0032D98653
MTTTTTYDGAGSVARLPVWTPAKDTPHNGNRAGSDLQALSTWWRRAAIGTGVLTLLLGVIGLVNSYQAVKHAAEPMFGWLAWTVPVGIDLGIAVFTGLDLVLAKLNMRPAWLRLVPWSLVGVTIYLNIADEDTWFGRVGHAVLPALWVVAVEVATHAIRTHARLTSTKKRMDRIRVSRWLLAPVPTLGLWRRMVLWEVRSYPDALARERDRLLAKTRLQDTYGSVSWRWKAPRRARALYRLGELAPTAQHEQVTAAEAPVRDEPTAARRQRPARAGRKPAGRKTTRKPARKLLADYVADARAVWTPGIEVTPAWVRSVTDCARGTSKAVADALRTEVGTPAAAGNRTAENGREAG